MNRLGPAIPPVQRTSRRRETLGRRAARRSDAWWVHRELRFRKNQPAVFVVPRAWPLGQGGPTGPIRNSPPGWVGVGRGSGGKGGKVVGRGSGFGTGAGGWR